MISSQSQKMRLIINQSRNRFSRNRSATTPLVSRNDLKDISNNLYRIEKEISSSSLFIGFQMLCMTIPLWLK